MTRDGGLRRQLLRQFTATLIVEYESFFELEIAHRKKVAAAIGLFYLAYSLLMLIAFYPLFTPPGLLIAMVLAGFATAPG